MRREIWRVVERRLGGAWAVQKKIHIDGLTVWAILTTDSKWPFCEYRQADWAKAREIADELNEREKSHEK